MLKIPLTSCAGCEHANYILLRMKDHLEIHTSETCCERSTPAVANLSSGIVLGSDIMGDPGIFTHARSVWAHGKDQKMTLHDSKVSADFG